MRILKEGDLSRLEDLRRFECSACGCIFEANNTEYLKQFGARNVSLYICQCPTCNKAVCIEDAMCR